MQTFAFSDKGPRSNNQDSYCVETKGIETIASVADGVGGNQGGEIASRLAVDSFTKSVAAGLQLTDCLESAHRSISEKAALDPTLYGMATTFTAVHWDGEVLKGVHTGDSRAYLLRGVGLKQLTKDHTEVARLVAEGKISKEDSVHYPRKNVLTSALGTHKNLLIDEFSFEVKAGDRLLLITDGIHGVVTKKCLVNLSLTHTDFIEFCEEVIRMVNNVTATDNFTLVGLEF
ncbi:PP2C family serine/threonine-protein phosphatase [Pseudomonas sp. UMAB-40]|uniref:PP2C family protein-serine/threonine phosphatase n=1 Tax=Pseudomonas sp. UMAB-40 TaxID=1365407 RepID=UPI001C59CC90|nr:protein phosphatase 2C domain-containing protein [Pseudomonas sp. UMAB-40]